MLRVENLGFSFPNQRVLHDVSFNVEEGELCGLFGPNGSGKTTLFKCCLHFLYPEKGTIFLNGKDMRNLTLNEMAKQVAYVPQEHKPPFPFPVKEVVLMGRTPYMKGLFNVSMKDKEKAAEVMKLVGIDHLADRPYNELSSGQRQLVLIARAIAQSTNLMLLDEPTSALDFSNQMHIWDIMRKIVVSGVTILACSHDPNHVAWFCDRIVVLSSDGTIIANGTPDEIIAESVLDKIYPDICSVRKVNEVPIVIPRHLPNIRE